MERFTVPPQSDVVIDEGNVIVIVYRNGSEQIGHEDVLRVGGIEILGPEHAERTLGEDFIMILEHAEGAWEGRFWIPSRKNKLYYATSDIIYHYC
jgi:hypothetical protein